MCRPPALANANDDSLISVVEDFLPTTSPTDFTEESDGGETFLLSGWNYLFELTAEAGTAAGEGETQVHPCNGADAHQQ